ncbi:MAG: NADH-quinone oxidoreductase subunit NuoK [Planctomycetaceae bacterium]|nr:NADH-quinone oxidoreductase subunit NuoK [Planctomycetaceae bacterium]
MLEVQLLYNYLVIGALLFGIGLVGLLSRRNMLIMFLAAEMMLQGVSLSLVAFGRFHNDWGGTTLVILILTVAACEAAILLALVQCLFHRTGNLDIAVWHDLRDANQPKFIDQEVPGDDAAKPEWPTLTPAGIEPEVDADEALEHRIHV